MNVPVPLMGAAGVVVWNREATLSIVAQRTVHKERFAEIDEVASRLYQPPRPRRSNDA